MAGAVASEGNRLGFGQWVLSHCTVHHLFLLAFIPLSLSFIAIIIVFVVITIVALNTKLCLYQSMSFTFFFSDSLPHFTRQERSEEVVA